MFKRYTIRLIARIIILIGAILMYFYYPQLEEDLLSFNILQLTILDVFWVAIFLVMIVVFAKRPKIAIGSLRFRKKFYEQEKEIVSSDKIKQEIKKQNLTVINVIIGWTLFNAIFIVLFYLEIIGIKELFLLSIFYYVCDLVCVVLYCPFQTIFMRNRCCNSCRIFNWAPIMMTTPLFFIPGIFGWTLCATALVVLITWEYSFYKHPERFLIQTNSKLKCNNCTDKLCKIRKPLK